MISTDFNGNTHYYDNDVDKYVFYDPVINFRGSHVIPLDGNEELVGFNGKTEILAEYVKELTEV